MEALLAHCAAFFSQHSSLYVAFFIGGLSGGFTHCLAMCGPLVASQTASCHSACAASGCSSRLAAPARATGAMYHLGRATSYGLSGFFAAAFSKMLAAQPYWHWVSSGMLMIAGLMFIASSLPGCRHNFPSLFGKLSYARGVLLGFMPCGLLYAALMMAAAMASPLQAMVAMWIFTLGTVPALLIASGSAEYLRTRHGESIRRAGSLMMAGNGAWLILLASKHLM